MSIQEGEIQEISYYASCDVNVPLKIQILHLEGNIPLPSFNDQVGDDFLRYSTTREYLELFVTCQLFAENKPLCLPFRTRHKYFSSDSKKWEEKISFPISIRDLPFSTQIAITIWDIYGPSKIIPIGGTTLKLFGKKMTLKQGKHKLYMWYQKEADGNMESSTPSKTQKTREISRRSKLTKRYSDPLATSNKDWLDLLVIQELKRIDQEESKVNDHLFLHVSFPTFEHPIIFHEQDHLTDQVDKVSEKTIGKIHDSEINRENPVETKHLKLTLGHQSTALERELKPNPKTKNQLSQIINYPLMRNLTREEKDLLWKFRFYLTGERKALLRFLKSTYCDETIVDGTDDKGLQELLSLWVPIDTTDALGMLSSTFKNKLIRAHAVNQLDRADDAELELYLLQLVQALKYEGIKKNQAKDSRLAHFLVTRATKNPRLGNFLYWYLKVETEDKKYEEVYSTVLSYFLETIHKDDKNMLDKQCKLINKLNEMTEKTANSDRSKMIDNLVKYLSDISNGLSSFEAVNLPLDPSFQVVGIVGNTATAFKSAKMPVFLEFKLKDGGVYPVIYKHGDDLRQDQLVIQVFQLMDQLLRKENLDLCLTPFKVLATGSSQGLLQCISAKNISQIIKESTLKAQLTTKAHLENFVKSTAGYCVLTYLLGVGDRHLDNIMLASDGRLIHIDFGYLFGKDPKFMPPAIRITSEMIDAMGDQYNRFQSYCFVSYNILRKSSNLILNLFLLMLHSNVPDINEDPERMMTKVQESLQISKTDEEAVEHLREQIVNSAKALMPNLMENFHKIAQYSRK